MDKNRKILWMLSIGMAAAIVAYANAGIKLYKVMAEMAAVVEKEESCTGATSYYRKGRD